MFPSLSQVTIILENYNFKFLNLPERLKCAMCHEILKNAKQTSCGCLICEKCIKSYLSDGPRPCPSNQSGCMNVKLDINRDIHQDTATNKEIANLVVSCPFNKCLHLGTLRSMVEHIVSCEFHEIICEKCGNKFLSKNKFNHNKNQCEMRMVTCHYCSLAFTFNDLILIHLNMDRDELCSKFVCYCPNNCNETRIINLKDHLKICANKKLECPFCQFYCKIDMTNKEKLLKHIQEEHLDHENEIKELLDVMKRISDLKIEKIDKLNKKGTSPTIQIVDNKSVMWKFTDFEARRVDAESRRCVLVTSDPFYTSEFGYKMYLRVYPAGDGVGKGTHFSVFIAIMKGEFDDSLIWPFQQKVTISILDQEGGSKHHSETLRTDATLACYEKPTEECNIAYGSPLFILLSLITNNSIYLRNDTILIKITVDTVD